MKISAANDGIVYILSVEREASWCVCVRIHSWPSYHVDVRCQRNLIGIATKICTCYIYEDDVMGLTGGRENICCRPLKL